MPVSSYTFKILLEGQDAIVAAKRIRAELQRELSQGLDLRQQMANIGTEAQNTAGRMAQMQQELKGATQEGGRLEVDLREADDATRQMVTDLIQGKTSADQLEQSLRGGKRAVEDTRQEVKWLGRDLQQVAQMSRMERLGTAMTAAAQQTYGLRTLAGGATRLGRGMMTTGAAIVGPLALAGRSYLQFADDAERAARQLKLNADLTEALKDDTLDLSASLGLFTPEEISQGLYTWASAIGAVAESQEDLNALTKDSTEIQKLAAMNQEQLGTTTEFVAAILGEFDMDTSQVNRTVSVLNYTADRTQATVGDLGQSFKYLGPVAADLGMNIESVAAAMGVAADSGIKGTQSGRAMRQMFIRLVKPTSDMNKAFNQALGLSGDLGQTWQDMVFPQGKFIGLAKFIDLLAASTQGMTDQQRQALLAQMATANELPTLTALVSRQIAARQEGINVLRAEEKIMTGVIDDEVRKYGEWKEANEGITVSLESATEAWEREWQKYEDSDVARAARVQKRWDAAWKRIGEAAVEAALPALEKVADLMDRISRHIEEHPEAVGAALKTGAILTGIGAFVLAAGKGVRLYADIKMITAAATMYQASTNMLEAAGLQATTGATFLSGVGKLVGPLALIAGALAAEKYVVEKAGVPDWMQSQTARGTESYEAYSKAIQELTQGRLEPLTRAQWEAVHAGQELGDVLEETGDRGTAATDDIAEEMRSLKEYERQTKKEAEDLGNELMQLPPATDVGIAKFTEAELEAIDELESYLRRRNDLIQEQNDELADMEREFQDGERERYRDYLADRADILEELQQVTQDPLWRATEEYKKSQQRQAEGYEDYQKRIAQIEEEYQKRLRDLREDHDDKMEGLEASRDARGILAERRRYRRAVRDAEERRDTEVEAAEERWEEIVETERQKLAEMREERKRDLEAKLQELDENYQEETQKRQLEFERKYQEKEQQNQKELQQLEKAHAERLARIMGWEEKVRDALRQSYVDREGDLRDHLAEMERMYLESYNMISQMSPEAMTTEEYQQWHEIIRGHQAGGYAGRGIYRLGEAGREFVLSASTTQALERAAGHLTQAGIVSMATGQSGGHYQFDINVRADQHFSPDFAAQTEAAVQQAIVNVATKVAKSKASGHRLHF